MYYYAYSSLKGRIGHMEDIYVHPAWRGSGVGTALWARLTKVRCTVTPGQGTELSHLAEVRCTVTPGQGTERSHLAKVRNCHTWPRYGTVTPGQCMLYCHLANVRTDTPDQGMYCHTWPRYVMPHLLKVRCTVTSGQGTLYCHT